MSKMGKQLANERIKHQPSVSKHGSVMFDVTFGNPYDITDNNLTMSNAIDLQMNLTPAQIAECQTMLTLNLQTVRQSMKSPSLVTSNTQKATSFGVDFGCNSHRTLEEHINDLRNNLTDTQLKECEDGLVFHLETVKVAKLLSDRGNVVLDLS